MTTFPEASKPSHHAARCRVTPIESPFKHCIHAYQGIDAWDQAGQRLLYAGFDDLTAGWIICRDVATGRETRLGQTNVLNFHTAARQRWALDDEAVVFKIQLEDGRNGLAMAHVDRPGQVTLLPWAANRDIRHVIDHGHQAIGTFDDGQPNVARIEQLDLHRQTTRPLLTVEQAMAHLPAELHDPAVRYTFHHPVVNHDQSRLFCKLMKMWPDGRQKFGAFYTMNLQTGTIRCLGARISGHPFWMSDGLHILNIRDPWDGSNNRHLVRVNADTGQDERIIDLPIEGPGHPAQSPDGRWVVTDAFVANGLESVIYLIDLKTRVGTEILRIDHHFMPNAQADPNFITRGQPHPVWSPCGTKILINHNHAGDHFGLLMLEDFLPVSE